MTNDNKTAWQIEVEAYGLIGRKAQREFRLFIANTLRENFRYPFPATRRNLSVHVQVPTADRAREVAGAIRDKLTALYGYGDIRIWPSAPDWNAE